jgi:hypothetical protein
MESDNYHKIQYFGSPLGVWDKPFQAAAQTGAGPPPETYNRGCCPVPTVA